MSKAQASIEITASSSRLAAGLNQARSKFQTFAAATARGMGAAFKSIKVMPGGIGANAIGGMLGGLGSKGFGAILDVAGDVRNFEKSLMHLQMATTSTPEAMAALRDSMTKTSLATSVSRDEIMSAASVYFDLTSDVQGMGAALEGFSRVAVASGANMTDIVKAGAAMRKLGIESRDLESAFSGLIAQGSAGKVGLKDMGAEFVSLIPKFAKFEGAMGRDGVMQLGAAFQVVAEDFGSASQAANALENMFGMLQSRQKQLAKAGIKIFDKKEDGTWQLQNLDKIIDGIRKKLVDPDKIGDVLGLDKEARSALDALVRLESKHAEVRAAGANTTAVTTRYMTMMESSSGQIDKSFNALKLKIAEAFTPERIQMFADGLVKAVELVDKLAGGIGKVMDAVQGFFGGGEGFEDFHKDPVDFFKNTIRDRELKIAGGMNDKEREQYAASLEKRGTALKGHHIEGKRFEGEGMIRAAEELRMRNRWAGGGASFDPMQATAATMRLTAAGPNALLRKGAEQLAQTDMGQKIGEMLLELKKQTQLLAKPPPAPTVEIGDNAVARAASRATYVRGHGGR
jgi:hypothetical protein